MTDDKMIRKAYRDFLFPGKKYLVTKTFLDARKSVHRVGESWVFLGYHPSGFGEATIIYASADDSSPCNFAIDWNSTENNLGLENVREYFEEIA